MNSTEHPDAEGDQGDQDWGLPRYEPLLGGKASRADIEEALQQPGVVVDGQINVKRLGEILGLRFTKRKPGREGEQN